MDSTVISLFWLLAVALVAMMSVQGLSRRVDLFSIRNLYLAGFIVYHIFSPVSVLRSEGRSTGFHYTDLDRSGNWMLVYVYVFAIVYLLSYHRLRLSSRLAAKIPITSATASDSMLTGLAISLVIASLVFQIISFSVPPLRGVAINIAVALAATGCAITGWVWGAHRLNPVVLLMVALVFSISIGVSLLGFFSRRPLISILAGFAWGAYYRWARQLPVGRLLISTLPLFLGAGVVVAAYTAIRTPEGRSTQETLQKMSQADLSVGSQSILGGQSSGAAALWILDTYPRYLEYSHLNSARTLVFWWVPSVLWPDKPAPLGNDIAKLARLERVNRDKITLPPGVVGYAAAEGGFYALILYAIFFGQFTRFFDELVRLHSTNPFVLLPVGCATGQFIGLARGEIAVFANLAMLSVISAFLILYLTALAFGGARRTPVSAWPRTL